MASTQAAKEELAMENTGSASEKAAEAKTAEKGDRMAELKEAATSAARRAMDYFTAGKTVELDQKSLEGGDINKEKYGETEPKAREKMRELKLEEEGLHDASKQMAEADKETAADRGYAARKTIYGAMGKFTDAVKDKLTHPTDIVQEARASREYGGPKRGEKKDTIQSGGPTEKTSDQ